MDEGEVQACYARCVAQHGVDVLDWEEEGEDERDREAGACATGMKSLIPAKRRGALHDRGDVRGAIADDEQGHIVDQDAEPFVEMLEAVPRESGYPVCLVIAGGGFRGHNREEALALCRLLKERNILGLQVRYRNHKPHAHDVLADARAAVRAARRFANDVGADASRVAVLGFSAGGLLATIAAVDGREEGDAPIALALNYPIISVSEDPRLRRVLRINDDDNATIQSLSPERRVPSSPPPLFCFTGSRDPCVHPGAADVLKDAWRNAGGSVESIHLSNGSSGDPWPHGYMPRKVADALLSFLERHFARV